MANVIGQPHPLEGSKKTSCGGRLYRKTCPWAMRSTPFPWRALSCYVKTDLKRAIPLEWQEKFVSSSPSDEKPAFDPVVWQWVVLSFGLVGTMAFAVAHAPPSWQRPGPTALWFSLVGGIVVGFIAVTNRIQGRWLVFLVGFLVIAVCIAGMTGERYRLYVKSLKDLYLGKPAGHNSNIMKETITHGPAMESFMEDFHAERRAIYETKRPFRVFLTFRLEALGISDEPWPLRFWLGEILVGGLVGAFAAMQWHKWQTEPDTSPASG
jgi:hypothetical protein